MRGWHLLQIADRVSALPPARPQTRVAEVLAGFKAAAASVERLCAQVGPLGFSAGNVFSDVALSDPIVSGSEPLLRTPSLQESLVRCVIGAAEADLGDGRAPAAALLGAAPDFEQQADGVRAALEAALEAAARQQSAFSPLCDAVDVTR
jgi:hypothetical protein